MTTGAEDDAAGPATAGKQAGSQSGWLGKLGLRGGQKLAAHTGDFATVFDAELRHLCDRHRIRALPLKPLPAAADPAASDAAMPPQDREDAEERATTALRMAAPRRRETAAPTSKDDPDYKLRDPDLRAAQLSALALSGGGIRSAAFASGVLQALAQAKRLESFDYLSTVSGGGYTGTALTWALYDRVSDPALQHERKGANDFAGLKITRNTRAPNAFTPGPGDGKITLLGHIRERASYLAPTQTLNLLTALGNTLRLSFSSFLIYSALALCPALLLTALYVFASGCLARMFWLWAWLDFGMPSALTAGGYLLLLLSGAGLLLLCLVPLGRQLWRRDFESTHAARVAVLQDFAAWCWRLLVVALGATIPLSHDYLARQDFGAALAHLGGLGVLGAIGGLLSLLERLDDRLRILLVRAAALILCYLAVLGLYAVSLRLVLLVGPDSSTQAIAAGLYIVVAAGIVWACSRYNPNFVSPHRFYRDRLMETFMPPASGGDYKKPDEANLSLMCGLQQEQRRPYRGPYHIINANIILSRSQQPRYYQRGGDSFILSPLYSGSAATGWLMTAKQSRRNAHSLSLATAMAISAAAANPNTASGDDGLMRRWSISFLMTLFNIRLGYWQPNPKMPVGADRDTTPPPSFLEPGALSLLQDYGSEQQDYVELSDGGHFDNTGLYELFRRRVRDIVLSDASCDPDFSLDDLGRALALAQVDFGIATVFDPMPQADSQKLWSELDRDPAEPNAYRGKGYPVISDGVRAKLLRDGFVTATIAYPAIETTAASFGRLIYLKPAIVEDAPVDLLAYALDHRDFPHRSTSDQFFSERRFESYRRLGFVIAEKMMKAVFAP